ncbi:MAG: hypothetical protein V7K55_08960 [Nostoc sp.]|uniref:hypothetical protein n=1 Tax=Nostoc sp. TaxID=1180 RepID=UPI002FF7CA61
MTTTVLELITNLKHYPDNTVVVIRDVDNVEFPIVDYQSVINTLEIVIGEKEEPESEE